MAPETFTHFQCLPAEIRFMVWKFALRPLYNQRHVHYFFVVTKWNAASHTDECVTEGLLRFGGNGRLNQGWKLAVPCNDADTWQDDSMYLWDSGLWMACHESREVIEKQFKKNEWWSQMPGSGQPIRLSLSGGHFNEPGASHTASYIDPQKNTNHITIRFNEDLIYFKPLESDNFAWLSQLYLDDVPLLDNRGAAGARRARPSFLGLNIAIDYDPAMMDVLSHRRIKYFSKKNLKYESFVGVIDVLHESAGRTLWFVDHRLRRRRAIKPSQETAAKEEREVFYSQNCVFTEIQEEDMSEWVTEDASKNGETVFDFLTRMRQHLGELMTLRKTIRLKVMACEQRDSG